MGVDIYIIFTTGLDSKRLKDVILELELMVKNASFFNLEIVIRSN